MTDFGRQPNITVEPYLDKNLIKRAEMGNNQNLERVEVASGPGAAMSNADVHKPNVKNGEKWSKLN